jgi:hypothetical protein
LPAKYCNVSCKQVSCKLPKLLSQISKMSQLLKMLATANFEGSYDALHPGVLDEAAA